MHCALFSDATWYGGTASSDESQASYGMRQVGILRYGYPVHRVRSSHLLTGLPDDILGVSLLAPADAPWFPPPFFAHFDLVLRRLGYID